MDKLFCRMQASSDTETASFDILRSVPVIIALVFLWQLVSNVLYILLFS